MPAYGLFSADQFIVTGDAGSEDSILPQAQWFFRGQTLALPKAGLPLPGFERSLSVWDDLASWVLRTSLEAGPVYPPLVWLGAPDEIRGAKLDSAALSLVSPQGRLPLTLTERLPLNQSWFDASSAAFFHGRPIKMRGNHRSDAFVAHSFWPEDFSLPARSEPCTMLARPAAFRDWVRALPQGGACSPFSVASIWRRQAGTGLQPGQPVIGFMLNGAQGDDDEAHGGHFALMTGRVGPGGEIDEWLVYNFYTLDSVSEKGIIAAPVPLDVYLADLNSGQAWYRPSCMLLAGLRDVRLAHHLDAALGRVFNQFYRHQFAYQHARANCAGTSISVLRTLGWNIPRRGAESWLKAFFGLPLVAFREKSLTRGKAVFDYLTEDRTRLYPAAAFEEIAADLLRLAQRQEGRPEGRAPSAFEQRLADDLDELLLVRIPQLPSSRAWGDWPVQSSHEYTARVPADPAQRKIIPVPPRPFPAALRDPLTPKEPPLRSDYALLAWGLIFLALILFILRRLLA